MTKKVILFLVLNFTALWLGSIFTSAGVTSDWYQNLLKAPWTPPGWVFGAAWSTIMIFYAFYMAQLVAKKKPLQPIIFLYGLQWILNISWNPIFFYLKQTSIGLFTILSLTLVVGLFFFKYLKLLGTGTLLIAPYFIWLLLASSLNLYIVLYN
jgi:translocator protein